MSEALDEKIYGGLGADVVTWLKRNAGTTKCCKVVALPGVFTRMALARRVNEMIRKAVRDELYQVAHGLDHEGFVEAGKVVRARGKAIKVQIRSPKAGT